MNELHPVSFRSTPKCLMRKAKMSPLLLKDLENQYGEACRVFGNISSKRMKLKNIFRQLPAFLAVLVSPIYLLINTAYYLKEKKLMPIVINGRQSAMSLETTKF